MRRVWLIFVGISLLGCKDKAPTQPAAGPTAPAGPGSAAAAKASAPPPAAGGGGAMNAPAPPTLPDVFDGEQEDKDWATNTERAIAAVAPALKNLECRTTECKGTLSAATIGELVKLTEQLQGPDGLPSTDAKNILLAGPPTDGGMASTITVYIRYER